MLKDYFRIAFGSLAKRKLRSWLTIIGVIIGVAAIISLISVVNGLGNTIEDQFKQMGSQKIFVAPKGFTGPTGHLVGLTSKDTDALKTMSDFDFVTEYYIKSVNVEFRREDVNLQAWGMTTDKFAERYETYGIEMISGRPLNNKDKHNVLLGYKVANDIFEGEITVGSSISLDGTPVRVVGVLEEYGTDDDKIVWIPIDTLRELDGATNEVTMIEVKVKDGKDIAAVADRMKKVLKRARDNENFEVSTPDQIIEQIDSILSIIQIVIVGIASISIIVGGVGITNSMFTSVLERTQEIGVMKSIGATQKDIIIIFLIEAALIGMIGGIIGMALGVGFANFIGYLSKFSGTIYLTIRTSATLMISSVLFAMAVGIAAGIMPAKRASEMSPVEALRYD